jgi:uncharacterized protein Yka (UPF0111/DUF47 family)
MNFTEIVKEELTPQAVQPTPQAPTSPVDGLALAKQLSNIDAQIQQIETKSDAEKKQSIAQLEKMKQDILLKIKNMKQIAQQPAAVQAKVPQPAAQTQGAV